MEELIALAKSQLRRIEALCAQVGLTFGVRRGPASRGPAVPATLGYLENDHE